MNIPTINFNDKKIKKNIFYKNKKPFNLNDIDINKILISDEVGYGTKNSYKYFIGYNDEDIIRPILIRLTQMIGYLKESDDSMIMSLRVDNSKMLKKYSKIWDKISDLLEIEFGSEPVYGDIDSYIKAKIKMYDNKVNKVKTKKFLKMIHHVCVNYIEDDIDITSSDEDDGFFTESDDDSAN